MKIHTNPFSTALLNSALAIFLMLFIVDAQAAPVKYDVTLEVINSGADLQVSNDQPTGKKCSKSNHKGCMRVENGKTAQFTFTLPDKVTCGPGSAGLWKLRDVYLGGKDSVSKPASNKWGGLDKEVQADFNVADYSTGRLNLKKRTTADGGSLIILDQNGSSGGYDVWYKIEAMCIDSDGIMIGGPIESDPRIENTGTAGL